MNRLSQIYFQVMEKYLFIIVGFIDQVRFLILKPLLRSVWVQNIYIKTSLRLKLGFVIVSSLNLFIALKRPDLLLVLGPLIYGYFHLVASYYFIQPVGKLDSDHSFKKTFSSFFYLTFFFILAKLILNQISFFQEIPSGFIELSIVTCGFMALTFLAKKTSRLILFSVLILNLTILYFAWFNPLLFVSATLFVHNWVAFFYWIIFSKNKENKITAMGATLIFGLVHLLVFLGYFDSFMNFADKDLFLIANIDAVSWVLSSWTSDLLISQRALVLYTLSLIHI